MSLPIFIVSQCSINYFKGNMHKHHFGQTLKLQSAVVTVNIYKVKVIKI